MKTLHHISNLYTKALALSTNADLTYTNTLQKIKKITNQPTKKLNNPLFAGFQKFFICICTNTNGIRHIQQVTIVA